ncbi:MAG: hypothetical protein ACRDIB_08380 [Ardenticatenaceae bacterium]
MSAKLYVRCLAMLFALGFVLAVLVRTVAAGAGETLPLDRPMTRPVQGGVSLSPLAQAAVAAAVGRVEARYWVRQGSQESGTFRLSNLQQGVGLQTTAEEVQFHLGGHE